MNKLLSKKLRPFVWHFLQPYKRVVGVYICLAMLAGCWGPFNSILIKHMINVISLHKVNVSSMLVLASYSPGIELCSDR